MPPIMNLDPLVSPDQFPLLARAKAEGNPVIYLDSAASAQKPAAVLETMRCFYETSYANIHRAVYPLSEAATEAYEGARARVAAFLGVTMISISLLVDVLYTYLDPRVVSTAVWR